MEEIAFNLLLVIVVSTFSSTGRTLVIVVAIDFIMREIQLGVETTGLEGVITVVFLVGMENPVTCLYGAI